MATTQSTAKLLHYLKTSLLVLILLIIAVRFITVGWNRLLLSSNSADGDQDKYLQLSLNLREDRVLSDGVRSPLYPALLATFAEREWSFFTWSKILSLSFGLILVLAVYIIGGRLFDHTTGVLAALLLSINMEFILHSTVVLAESLLSLLMLLTWFFMVLALQKPKQIKFWMIAGLFAGMTYLAKGTGLIIIISFVLTATLLFSYRIWFRRVFWGFAGGLAAISLPMWIYNWFVFGSPIYNFAINNVMWMDTAEEKFFADASELPTMRTFLKNNSPVKIWARLWDGLVAMRFFFAKSLWPTRSITFDRFLLAGGLDAILVLLIMAMLIFWRYFTAVIRRNREMLLLTTILFGLFYALFGWYLGSVSTAVRFLIPLSAILLLLIAAAMVGLAKIIFTHSNVPRWGKVASGIVLALVVLWFGNWFVMTGVSNARSIQKDLFVEDAKLNEYNEQALRWTLTGHTGSEADQVTVLWGPTHNLPIWRQANKFHSVRTPMKIRSLDQLNAFMEAEGVAYIIVDDDMARRRRKLMPELGISRIEGELLTVDEFPSDWALGLTAPTYPCRWCVFRRLSANPPIKPVDFLLAGDSIRLLGYELVDRQFYPGGQLTVILYWEALQPVSTDYTIFTQLLGPDFQLHGQVDRQPLSGHFPTSRWMPGQKLFDKFVVDVSETAPPGEYTLLVGLYDLNTGQRASIVSNGRPLPDNAIRLFQLPVQAAEPQ